MDGGCAPSGIGRRRSIPMLFMLMFAVWKQTSCHNEIRFMHLPVPRSHTESEPVMALAIVGLRTSTHR